MHKISRLVFVAIAAMVLLLATVCSAQVNSKRSDPSVNLPCPECGVIVDIREQKRERESARNLPLDTASPAWTFRFTPGDKADPHPHVDVVGSRSMRETMTATSYIVVVRFDDNRWQRIDLPDVTGLKIGDRIHVHQNQIEPDDGYAP